MKFQPQAALPKEKERLITETQSQVSFVMSDALKLKLEKVRALLGVRGAGMSYAELFDEMAELSVVALEAKKFGKKRSESVRKEDKQSTKVTPASQVNTVGLQATSPNKRYICKALAQEVWKKYKSACANCGVSKNLQIDHIVPLGLGGVTLLSNLRLLCFNCNQRAAMKSFGVEQIRNYQQNRVSASGGDYVT